jgi:hypothetical protein
MNPFERLSALETQLAALGRDRDTLRDQLTMQQRYVDQLIDMVVEIASRQVAMMSPAQKRALANETTSLDPAMLALIDLHDTKR